MGFNEILIKARFLDADGNPKGREYTYIFKRNVPRKITILDTREYFMTAFPAFVQTEEGKKLLITELFTDPAEVETFADKLKYVVPYVETTESDEPNSSI